MGLSWANNIESGQHRRRNAGSVVTWVCAGRVHERHHVPTVPSPRRARRIPLVPPVGKSDTQALLDHLQPRRSLSRVESDMIGTLFVQRQQLGQLADPLATWTLYEYIVGRLTYAGYEVFNERQTSNLLFIDLRSAQCRRCEADRLIGRSCNVRDYDYPVSQLHCLQTATTVWRTGKGRSSNPRCRCRCCRRCCQVLSRAGKEVSDYASSAVAAAW